MGLLPEPGGYIFIVDDLDENLQVLGSTLTENGYDVAAASGGIEAIEILEEEADELPDLILLDVMMPEMDGWDTCKKIKENPRTKDIPVIFLTAKSEVEDVVRGFDSGGVDYITKPFNSRELLARVKTHLELRYSKAEIQKQKDKLEAAYTKINKDLHIAEKYIKSTFPGPIDNDFIKIVTEFIPTATIGGDTFGYRMIDEDNFAFYMIDVSGHGVSSALLSVSQINTLRFGNLPNTNFKSPAAVLEKLNEKFDMADHDFMYSTVFYAVYNRKNRILTYAAGGHPPALLVSGNYPGGKSLSVGNSIIGARPGTPFYEDEIELSPASTVFVFTDGAFEVVKINGDNHTIAELHKFLAENTNDNHDEARRLYARLLEISGTEKLKDDFSIVKCIFK